MRIIGGKFKGMRLEPPSSNAIRPTSDRMRETVFNVLMHQPDFSIENSRILDLFAGSGANGLEAMSRGARFCLFVDSSANSRALIRSNIEKLGLEGITKVYRRDVTQLGPVGSQKPFNLVILDPPYRKGLGEATLKSALSGKWLAPKSLCVIEEDLNSKIEVPVGFKTINQKICGNSQVVFLNLT